MGREVRRVPPDWDHPVARRSFGEGYQPMRDRDAEDAWAEWQREYAGWLGGEHARVAAEYGGKDYPPGEPYRAFCRWHGGPPDPAYYRPKWAEGEATWFQAYETVSEGTPVTPPFATKEELIDYLVAHGDYWDQERVRDGTMRGPAGWDRVAAERFVGAGWAPSLVVTSTRSGATVKEPRDGI